MFTRQSKFGYLVFDDRIGFILYFAENGMNMIKYRLLLLGILIFSGMNCFAQDWAKVYYRYLSDEELGTLFGVRRDFLDQDTFGVFEEPYGYSCIDSKQIATKCAEVQLDLSDGMIAIMEVYFYSISGKREKKETFTGLITESEVEDGVIEIYWSSATDCRSCQLTCWGKRKDNSDYGGGRRAEVTEKFRANAFGLEPKGIIKNVEEVFWFNKPFSISRNKQFTDISDAVSMPGSVNTAGPYRVFDESAGRAKIWAITRDGNGTSRVHWFSLKSIENTSKPIMAAIPGWEVMTSSELQQLSEHLKSTGNPLFETVADASNAGFNMMFGDWSRNTCHSSSSRKQIVLYRIEVLPEESTNSKKRRKG